ncbi:hypothetical protein DPX16_2878 [Anabarilius grahami]|uniref:Uncharacterized protein n=1 Tax=Anabarilius grahami TaxID=495550 RepID=A0A3N0ZA14_ANAGA|nr:hypothetical protein DPX16_2878 [Anabarilius grahami]
MRLAMASSKDETSDDISADRDGKPLTTEEELEKNVEKGGEDEVEENVEQRGEEEREVEMEQRASKYFAVELDCTPDISKQEQASVIIRYVHTDDNKNATINESFVGFTVVKDTTEITYVSKAMQAVNISIDTAIRMIDSLKEFLLKYRVEGFTKCLAAYPSNTG